MELVFDRKKYKKSKLLYNIFVITTYYDNYGPVKEHREYMGQTLAVSEEQATNNARFRLGMSSPYTSRDWGYDGSVDTWIIVELA